MDFLNTIRTFFRENPRMWVAVAGALLSAGLVVWLVYGQASIQFSKFFAAEPSAFPNVCGFTEYQADPASCGCTATYPGQSQPEQNQYTIPHVCTKAFKEGDTNYSDQVWWGWDQQYGRNRNCPAADPYLTYRLQPDGTAFGTPLGCVEKPPDCPDGYYAFDKGGQNFCYVATTGGSTPTPPVTTGIPPTTTPVSTVPVVCSPQTQTVTPGQSAALEASGGNGTFQWNVTGGGIVESGGNQSLSVSYQTPGTKTLRVSSGAASTTCTVVVQSAASVTPVSGATLTVQKLARNLTQGDIDASENITVSSGTTVQFVITVVSQASAPLAHLMVKDIVPPGMTYQPGSTYVNGQQVSVDTIATSGLSLGTLLAGEQFTARWSAVADHVGQLVTGVQESRPLVTVTADGITPVGDDVTLEIQGTGTGSSGGTVTATPSPVVTGVGGVQTGPGDAVGMAFVAAAVLTLLYTAYTRSPGFIRKEAEKISRDQDHLDFRS